MNLKTGQGAAEAVRSLNHMLRFLIVCAYSFLFFGTLSAALWGRISFTSGQRSRYPFLTKLDGKQIYLAICTCAFLFLSTVAFIAKEFLTFPSPTEVIQGPQGELLQKATISGFDKELEDAAGERQREAKVFFEAAERDFLKERYGDAAQGFQKSLEAIQTMSSYLNLGVSLSYVSDFRKAEDALITGLRMARNKGNQRFEADFLSNLGTVNADQGKLDKALDSFQEVLTLSKETGYRWGEAAAVNNIGGVYRDQNKWEEALNFFQKALALFKEIGDNLGQAATLQNIGGVYRDQGNVKEALKFSQQALALFREIGYRRGEAGTLNDIGVVHADQGNVEEALKFFQQALALFREIGYRQGEANALSNLNQTTEDWHTGCVTLSGANGLVFRRDASPTAQHDSRPWSSQVYQCRVVRFRTG
jgi:tetratricopeptide (TPR) repeat protein